MSETTFKFIKSKYIWKFINKKFDLCNMNDIYLKTTGEGDYTFLLAEKVPTDIYECINEDTGCLIENTDGLALLDLTDVYFNLDGVEMPYFQMKTTFLADGAGFTVELDSGDNSNIQIQVGDSQDIYVQGMFLVKRETTDGEENFVMSYATIHKPINIKKFINVVYNGLVFGVGQCGRNLSNTNLDDVYYTI